MRPMKPFSVTSVDDGESHMVDAYCAVGAATRWAQLCKRDVFSGPVRVRVSWLDDRMAGVETCELEVSADCETGSITVDEEV